jgi:hypothetical protein
VVRRALLIFAGPVVMLAAMLVWRAALAALVCSQLMGCSSEAAKPPKNGGDGEPRSDGAATEPAGDGKPDGEDGGEGEAAGDEGGLPKSCAKTSGDICLPAEKFVRKLCDGDYPTVALNLFSAGTPWTRAYLAHETNAWNASGGGSSNEKLALDEEVIILRHRSANDAGGIQVSGAEGGYDALRWDGACVTLDASEVRFDPPDRPRNARLIWSRIEYDTREALKGDEVVKKTFIAYKNECKGVTSGEVSKECVKRDTELSETIAAHVRQNGGLPPPKKLP